MFLDVARAHRRWPLSFTPGSSNQGYHALEKLKSGYNHLKREYVRGGKKVKMTNEESEDLGEAIERQIEGLDPGEANVKKDRDENEDDECGKSENVRVMVRCRPLMKPKERTNCVVINEVDKCVELADRQFQYDAVFGPESDNEKVYMKSVRQLVESAFQGYNCTVFLYGQTGTGKTYTHSSLTSSSFAHLFSLIRDSNTQLRFLIRASYYELYNEEIRDLLSNSKTPLELRESKARGVYVNGLTCYLVNNLTELEKLKRVGDRHRTTAATRMNEHSSRSHSIFSITIETVDNNNNQNLTRGLSSSRQTSAAGRTSSALSSKSTSSGSSSLANAPVRVGRLHLIDLAGSERQSKSGSTGVQLKEASRINLSLTCLALVIRALTDPGSGHIPYRNSKLTRLLSGSLGGNSKTLLIACISPAKSNLDESMNTLRFASRTKRIKNKTKINEDAKDALLRKYRRQVEELRSKLLERQHLATTTKAADDAINDLLVKKQASDEASSGTKEATTNSGDSELLNQLRLLRAKIMVGGENLLEKAEMHERLLEASRQELDEKRSEELRLKEKLEKKRQLIDKMTQSKGSLESQVVDLDEKLKRVLILYKRTKEEQRDLASEHQQLKDNLLSTIRATSKEIKYADCIIDDYIPGDYLDLINAYAQYDEESDEWQIKYIALSGNNIAQTKKLSAGQVVETTALRKSNLHESSRPDPLIRLKDLTD